MSPPLRVIVIGGGAAGFFGAIATVEANPRAQVTLIEASRQPLAKVRISGGGRCNVTHACFEPAELVQHYPRGAQALRSAFSRFQASDTVNWFAAHGVKLKTEADGRMFPITDDSASIVECLLKTAKAVGVEILLGAVVNRVKRQNLGFEIELKSGKTLVCNRLLLATGSSRAGYEIAQSLGHQIELPVPSLFTFNIADDKLHDLAGVSVDCVQLRLVVAGEAPLQQVGGILITHWGLSGPAVLKLSAWGARLLHNSQYQAALEVNWLPQVKSEDLRQKLLAVKSEWGKKAIHSVCPIPSIPRRLWQYLASRAGIESEERWAELSNKMLSRILQELTQGSYLIQGKGVFKEEFVTCGGISLKEVNFKTMASRCCPGLYFAGEILDIDGVTGGLNFQSAWTTAWIAGNAMGNQDEI